MSDSEIKGAMASRADAAKTFTEAQFQIAHAAGIRACNWPALTQEVSLDILLNYLPAAAAQLAALAAPVVPEEVRRLSEAAPKGRWARYRTGGCIANGDGLGAGIAMSCGDPTRWPASADFVCALVNWFRDYCAADPARAAQLGCVTDAELHAILGLEEDETLTPDADGEIVTCSGAWRREGDRWRFFMDSGLIEPTPSGRADIPLAERPSAPLSPTSIRPDWHKAMFPDEPATPSKPVGDGAANRICHCTLSGQIEDVSSGVCEVCDGPEASAPPAGGGAVDTSGMARLHERECDALMQIIHALGDLSEPWIEGAGEASASGEKDHERRDMRVNNILTGAGNSLMALIRDLGPQDYFPRTMPYRADPRLLTAARDHIDGLERRLSLAAAPAAPEPAAGGETATLSLSRIRDAISYFSHCCQDGSVSVPRHRLLEWREGIRAASDPRPIAAEPQAAGDGWRTKAADEIEAISKLWTGDSRAYARTIAAMLRAAEPTPANAGAEGGQA